jgi:ADP-ribose pyrophosphatase YjhB (NUDIX family)
MATQAGATVDEDFPGIAALVDPTGEVVARLPDGRAGELVVEVPQEVTVEPVREAVRALVVDEHGRALLLRYEQQGGGRTWWATPGGGVESGEDHAAAIRRELGEELQRDDLVLGPWIGRREVTFRWHGRWLTQREHWLLCRAPGFEVDPAHVATLVAEDVHGMRWWSADELRAAGVATAPRRLPDLLDDLAAGVVPAPDDDLGR